MDPLSGSVLALTVILGSALCVVIAVLSFIRSVNLLARSAIA